MSDPPPIFNILTRAQTMVLTEFLNSYPIRSLLDSNVRAARRLVSLAHRNPLVRLGEKYYSQNDEDGIILEICRRLRLSERHFIELGAGNGLENNSLILLMSGWRGAWLGDNDLAFTPPMGNRRLVFEKSFITRENAHALWLECARRLDVGSFDLLSIDLDGNDRHILEALLEQGARPAVIVVEYNGKFPPPIRFCVDYDPGFVWDGTDYSGASLQSFVDLLDPAGYRLVACNITGLNAFFVDDRFGDRFQDVPTEIEQLFMPADYSMVTWAGHQPSPQTVLSFLSG